MKTLMPILAAVIFTSCSPTIMPLKGSYSDKPFEVVSDKPIDSVWSNIIDLFATKGLSIKVIDKSSGLIVSEKTSMLSNYTFEDATGKLRDPNAWVVLSKVDYAGTSVTPDKLTGEWNVRIKPNGEGKTIINVNLTNIEATRYLPPSQYSAAQSFVFTGRSTGKFEQAIAEFVK